MNLSSFGFVAKNIMYILKVLIILLLNTSANGPLKLDLRVYIYKCHEITLQKCDSKVEMTAISELYIVFTKYFGKM